MILTLCGDRTTRRSADGRWPVRTGTHYYEVAVHQITASEAGSRLPSMPSATSGPLVLEVEEFTVLTGWAEGVAEALAHAAERAGGLLADAQAGASWRTAFGISGPSPRLSEAIESIREAPIAAATPIGGAPSFDALLNSVRQDRADQPALSELVAGRAAINARTSAYSTNNSRRRPVPPAIVSTTSLCGCSSPRPRRRPHRLHHVESFDLHGSPRDGDRPPPAPGARSWPVGARERPESGGIYWSGIQLPWKPSGIRAGRCTRATGSAVKSWAARMTRSAAPRSGLWTNAMTYPSSSPASGAEGANTASPAVASRPNSCACTVPGFRSCRRMALVNASSPKSPATVMARVTSPMTAL